MIHLLFLCCFFFKEPAPTVITTYEHPLSLHYALPISHDVGDDWAIIVPAGVWHNVVNTGDGDLKLYSIYAPPEHPAGTIHRTKADADAAEHPKTGRSEEHTSELQSLMRISYAVFCLKKKKTLPKKQQSLLTLLI